MYPQKSISELLFIWIIPIPNGNIVFDEIVDCSTNEIIDIQNLTTIAQIECNKHCREYVSKNKLSPYENIFPMESYPYRFPDHENADKTHFAEIIQFPNI